MAISLLRRPAFQTGGNFGSPKIDLGGCVLYVPLWRPESVGSPFNSSGVYGVPVHVCTKIGTTWGIQGVTFDGNDDNITIPDSPALRLTDLTIGVWSKVTDTKQYNTFVSKRGVNCNYQFHTNTAVPAFYYGTGNVNNTNAISLGAWHMLVVAVASNKAAFIVDGILGNSNLAVSIVTNTEVLTIGQDGVSGIIGALGGIEGELWLYSRALTVSEIVRIYQSTKWRYQ